MVSEVIAGPPLSGVLNIAVKTSSMGDAEQDVSIARNFQPGHAYDIILRFSDHGMINADVYVSEWQTNPPIHEELAANMYYDLSTIETSNCYIVRSANYSYCFDGTVKGNGEGALVGMTAADTKLNPGWVDVLWSDLPTDIDLNGDGTADPLFALQNHKLSEGKVLFDLFGYTTTNADGTTTQHLTLLHHDNNAAQHFYQTVYVSCPLFTLPKTDSIRFRVTTFNGELIFE
jgi:hypothetical protein